MAAIIQIRRDTSTNWTTANPTLAQGEFGVETNTNKIKIGNGTTAWNSLGYIIDTGTYLTNSSIGTTVQGYDGDLQAISTLAGTSGILTKTAADTWTLDTNSYVQNANIGVTVQGYDADLQAIGSLTGTSGILTKTAADTWALDTNSYLQTSAIGTTVQGYDGDLQAISTLAGTSGILTKTAANTWTLDTNSYVNSTNGIAANITLNGGYTEAVYAITGTTPAISPTNGSIQTWSLSASSTPTAGTWNAGQSITLMIQGGGFTVTWSSLAVTWKTDTGTAPTLNASGYTAIVLWKINSTIFGARVGNA